MIYFLLIIGFFVGRYYYKALIDYVFYAEFLLVAVTVLIFAGAGLDAAEGIAPYVFTGFIMMFVESFMRMFVDKNRDFGIDTETAGSIGHGSNQGVRSDHRNPKHRRKKHKLH